MNIAQALQQLKEVINKHHINALHMFDCKRNCYTRDIDKTKLNDQLFTQNVIIETQDRA